MGTADNVIATARPGEGGGIGSSSESYYFYNKDTRGSTTNLLNANGQAICSYQYTDFGETSVQGEADIDNEICYTGGIYDAEAQLYYLNARYYDPEGGRFLTQDTYRGEKNDPGTWHLYSYCSNDPINYYDPSGHKSIASLYYSYTGNNTQLTSQAEKYWKYKKSDAEMKPFHYRKGFRAKWNSIGTNITKVYIFVHGSSGKLYFRNGVSADKKYLLGKFTKGSNKGKYRFKRKSWIKTIVLLSCYGGAGGNDSIARGFYELTNKKADVWASKESVSYRFVNNDLGYNRYKPRYSWSYIKEHGAEYYFKNPVKKQYSGT